MYNIQAFIDSMGVEKEDAKPLFDAYLEEMKDMLVQLHAANEKSDIDQLTRIMHNVKGINANLMVEPLLQVASQYYKDLQDQTANDHASQITALANHYEEIAAVIQAFYQ